MHEQGGSKRSAAPNDEEAANGDGAMKGSVLDPDAEEQQAPQLATAAAAKLKP